MHRALILLALILALSAGGWSSHANAQASPVYLCSDALDNDGDGLVDYPADTGCTSTTDNDEAVSALPLCSDGIDNDGDGSTDYPADGGCGSFSDTTEDTPFCVDNCACTDNPDLSGSDTGAGDPDTTAPSFVDCNDYGSLTVCPLNREECTAQSYSVFDPSTGTNTSTSSYQCPSGPEHTCALDPSDGKRYCSRNQCVSKTSTPTDTTDTGGSIPSNDGPVDASGNCLGTIRVFGGAAKRCRRAGTQTNYQNCCDNDKPPLEDTMGAEGEPDQISYRKEHSTFEIFSNQCDQQDQETALLADSDYCVYLGTYCAEKWAVVGCVQRNRSYCCFNSKLAAIIQRQGRAQIPSMGGFGTAKRPDCRGFSMEEFQALDFSKIDLSGYYSDIRTKGQATIQGEAQDAARSRFAP